jgi:hypothetical protein
VFESGKAFVPFVNKTLYGQLEAMGGEVPAPPASEPAPSDPGMGVSSQFIPFPCSYRNVIMSRALASL